MSKRPIALVTGASKGIGAAVAELFAQNGFDICINYLSDESGAQNVSNACENVGAQTIIAKADISKPDQVAVMFQCLAPFFCTINFVVLY